MAESCRDTCPIFQLCEAQIRYAFVVGDIATRRYLDLLDHMELIEKEPGVDIDEANRLSDLLQGEGPNISEVAESIDAVTHNARQMLQNVTKSCTGLIAEERPGELILRCNGFTKPALEGLTSSVREYGDYLSQRSSG